MDWIRITACIALAAALTGCQDLGLAGNIPLAEAEERPPTELVAAVMAPTATEAATLIVDGRLWLPWGLPLTLEAAELAPIGAAGGRTVHARTWDRPPYDRVFVRLERAVGEPAVFGPLEGERWQAFAPVVGRTGRVQPSAEAVGPGGAGQGGAAGAAEPAGAH